MVSRYQATAWNWRWVLESRTWSDEIVARCPSTSIREFSVMCGGDRRQHLGELVGGALRAHGGLEVERAHEAGVLREERVETIVVEVEVVVVLAVRRERATNPLLGRGHVHPRMVNLPHLWVSDPRTALGVARRRPATLPSRRARSSRS